ncbi:MAG: ATP-grasp domain-containing protein [Nitrospiraceae bacterium]
MPRVLFLLPTASYRAEAFLEAAQRLQLDVTVASESPAGIHDRASTGFLPITFRDTNQAVRSAAHFAATHPIDAVIGVEDQTTVVAAAISAALGLPHNPVASAEAARNKHRMRELLRGQGVPVPCHHVFSISDDAAAGARTVSFPCVLKPLVLSASCGVIRANDAKEFAAAFARVAALLTRLGLTETDAAARQILSEDFVPGREVALEGLLTAGALRVLALFDKPDPLDGPFFEETIYVTPSRLPAAIQQDIAACAAKAAQALGLREGPVHGELRVNEDGVWLIEMAARSIGGRCSRTLRFAADLSLEEVILRHALRMEIPSLDLTGGAAGVMMLPIPYAGILSEVRGQDEARAVPGIEELTITAQPGDELVPLPEGTRYLGFLIARAETPATVEAALREAHRRLAVVIRATPTRGPRAPACPSGSRVVTF